MQFDALKNRILVVVLTVASCTGAAGARGSAQAPANSNPSQGQGTPNNSTPNQQNKPPEANPFPEDTNTVPVLPSANSSGTPPPSSDAGDYRNVALPAADSDPVHSPDDATSPAEESGSSSSSSGMDNLLKPPPDTGRHGKGEAPEQTHQESAKEDESVGSYYLDQKNWKAALSRFESAVVLDPENPDVYWGLAEAERHTGDYTSAKANYLKVLEYDPDSKHSKEAKRILKDPELSNAKAVSANAPAPPAKP